MFGERLKMLRNERKMKQDDLAKVVNVHRATIGKYETNERFPDRETLLALADYFGVSTDFLLGKTEVRTPLTKNPRCIDLTDLSDEDFGRVQHYIGLLRLQPKPDRPNK